MAIQEPVLLRPAEAAAMLGVSRSKLYQMAASGEVAGVIRLGGSIRIHAPTLSAWLAEQADRPRAVGSAAP